MKDKNNYAVIMAGGIGTRFWPMSTVKVPKQYHDVLGSGRTLIQQTYDRLLEIVPQENIYVITNLDYLEITKLQLCDLVDNKIIGEPCMMNTAACNIYIAKKIHSLNPNANLIIAPSDHIILNQNNFKNIALESLKLVQKENYLITLGIEPTHANTGYGYIQYETDSSSKIKKVKKFTEKPDEAQAAQFIESGDFLWNAGIFIWNTQTILSAFKIHLPEMYETFNIVQSYNTLQEFDDIKNIYPTLQKTSIDYGIMEKSNNVYVIPSNFGWSDLGTWKSLFENSNKTAENNVSYGKFIQLHNSTNCIIQSKDDKAIIIDGLNNYIVADTSTALLICPINNEQEVKNYVNHLKEKYGNLFL